MEITVDTIRTALENVGFRIFIEVQPYPEERKTYLWELLPELNGQHDVFVLSENTSEDGTVFVTCTYETFYKLSPFMEILIKNNLWYTDMYSNSKGKCMVMKIHPKR